MPVKNNSNQSDTTYPTDPSGPTVPSDASNPSNASSEQPKGSRIKKADKIAVMNCVGTSFAANFPQLSTEDIQGLARHFGDLMCRKIAKTPLYMAQGTITVQCLRDAFGAVIVERVLHKDCPLRDSIPTSPESARIVCGTSSPFDSAAVATTIPSYASDASSPSNN